VTLSPPEIKSPRGTGTFRYIAEYLETNIQPYRLEVACSDFGYTLCEIDSLRMNGKTTRDIAAEIVSRGVRSSCNPGSYPQGRCC